MLVLLQQRPADALREIEIGKIAGEAPALPQPDY